MKITLCDRRRSELMVSNGLQTLVNSIREWVGSLNDVTYFRASLRIRDKYFDILRCISRSNHIITHLRLRFSKPYLMKLFEYLIESDMVADTYIELTLCTLDEGLLRNSYVGDLHLMYGITPVSRVLTYVRLRDLHNLIFDDIKFNLCTFTEYFNFVGCVVVDYVLNKEVIEEVVRVLLDVVKSMGLKLRYVTWLLDSNYLNIKLIDY